MALTDLSTDFGALRLDTPLIAASGTVGAVWEWAQVADVSVYGAAVAKSVAPVPWAGRPAPRLAPNSTGMLNGIGIQNPGIESWTTEMPERIERLQVPVWGSTVAEDVEGYALVAKGLESAGVSAVEVNLSCPNLDTGEMFSFDASAAAAVVAAVVGSVSVPVGAKLSPNTPDIVGVAGACIEAGAGFLVLTNTALGFGVSVETGSPLLSGGVGGYSGPGLKPLAMRCVYEVARSLPGVPIVGCGGISTGRDVIEYLMAGASAVEIGTVLLAEPRAGARILKELRMGMERLAAGSLDDVIGRAVR
jgi:dihydroorotate dehydrogenase (NAD+) catalytic subunit